MGNLKKIEKRLSKEKNNTKKGFNLKSFMIFIGVCILVFILYIGYKLINYEKRLIPTSIIAMIAGVIYENKRITENWKTVLYTALGSFILSFVALIPGKRERIYDLESHIKIYPYVFILIFILFTIVYNEKKIVLKLTEGITLMQSVAVIYWFIDYGFVIPNNNFVILVMVIAILLAIFSILHALTNIELTRANRLILSVWSSIILLLFSFDYIFSVYQNVDIENTNNLTNNLWIWTQYFLLGISCVYIVHNMMMLLGFLPSKNSFFNATYFREIKVLKNIHINRYSAKQINIWHSLFCILFTSSIFYLNYKYKVLPSHTVIWLVFVFFPVILDFYEYLRTRNFSRNS